MNGQIRFLDEGIGPDAAHERVLFHQMAMIFEEHYEDIDGLPRERDKLAFAKEQVLRTVEAEAAELPLEIFGPSHEGQTTDLELFKAFFRTFVAARWLSITHTSGQAGGGFPGKFWAACREYSTGL